MVRTLTGILKRLHLPLDAFLFGCKMKIEFNGKWILVRVNIV